MKCFDILNCGFLNQVSYDHRSYERNFRTLTGFGPVTSRYRCDSLTNLVPRVSLLCLHCLKDNGGREERPWERGCSLTNWAMKPLTLGAGHLWVLMSTWRMDVKWYMKCFIYWTADDHSSLDFSLVCSPDLSFSHLSTFSGIANVFVANARPLVTIVIIIRQWSWVKTDIFGATQHLS